MVLGAFAFATVLFFAPDASRPSEASADLVAGIRSRSSAAASPYTLFESGQVRPLAMSPDKQLLFAINTPDGFEGPGTFAGHSLRGLASHGPMHWRGDRTGGNDASSAQPDSGSFDERAAFDKFNEAFPGLLGRHAALPQEDMDAFTEFILQITYPPNPNRRIDNVLTADQDAGRQLFDRINCGIPAAEGTTTVLTCSKCHVTNPSANPGTAKPGVFGTAGFSGFDFNPQLFKVPHLRNLYQRSECSGIPRTPDSSARTTVSRAIRCVASASSTIGASIRCSVSPTD